MIVLRYLLMMLAMAASAPAALAQDAAPFPSKTVRLIVPAAAGGPVDAVARILAEDVQEPRGVACITYNNECARELANSPRRPRRPAA